MLLATIIKKLKCTKVYELLISTGQLCVYFSKEKYLNEGLIWTSTYKCWKRLYIQKGVGGVAYLTGKVRGEKVENVSCTLKNPASGPHLS